MLSMGSQRPPVPHPSSFFRRMKHQQLETFIAILKYYLRSQVHYVFRS